MKHIPSDFSMSAISSFKSIQNKHYVYRGKDCMKKFDESLRGHAKKIINFEKEKMKLLTKELQYLFQNVTICYNCKDNFEDKSAKDKKDSKVMHHCHYKSKHRGDAHSICNYNYSEYSPRKNVLNKESKSDYHFIIKGLAGEFEKQFNWLGKNIEKCIKFSVPVEKEVTRIKNKGKEITKTISYRLQSICGIPIVKSY